MSTNDKEVLGLRGELAEIDRQEERYMYSRSVKDGPAPYCLPGQDPLDAIEDVARGLRPETMIMFWPTNHIIEVGQQEWSLDGNLQLWRDAKAYADQFVQQGRLVLTWDHWAIKYIRA